MLRLILFAVLLILVVRLLLRLSAQRKPAVQADAMGISLRGQGATTFVGWNEIRQIDVCRMPAVGVDGFAVILFANNTEMVLESFGGFAQFSQRLLEHWPQIRSEWVRVQGGPPNISERVTVWAA